MSDIEWIARYKGSRSNAVASGRFGLIQRERVGSREGLVQDVGRGYGQEQKTLPMADYRGAKLMSMRGDKTNGKVIQYQ